MYLIFTVLTVVSVCQSVQPENGENLSCDWICVRSLQPPDLWAFGPEATEEVTPKGESSELTSHSIGGTQLRRNDKMARQIQFTSAPGNAPSVDGEWKDSGLPIKKTFQI